MPKIVFYPIFYRLRATYFNKEIYCSTLATIYYVYFRRQYLGLHDPDAPPWKKKSSLTQFTSFGYQPVTYQFYLPISYHRVGKPSSERASPVSNTATTNCTSSWIKAINSSFQAYAPELFFSQFLCKTTPYLFKLRHLQIVQFFCLFFSLFVWTFVTCAAFGTTELWRWIPIVGHNPPI